MATISADPACRLADSGSQVRSSSDKPTAGLLDRDINKILERKLRSTNFRVLCWSLDPIAEKNGFLGQYYTLSVTVKIDDKSHCLRFFAKTPPPSASPQLEFLQRFDTFNKEISVYNEIVPKMGRGSSGFEWLPNCYLGKNNAIMVLEDATIEGYVTPDKQVPFDEEHCVWAVRALSMLQSRSLILDEKRLRLGAASTIFDLYGHLLREVLFNEDDVKSRRALASSVQGAFTCVDLADDLKDRERPVLKNRIARWAAKLPEMLKPSKKFRNALCHRDVWPNNIMFRRDEAGTLSGCYMVDFQFLSYCPPAFDFVFFLFLSTDRANRDRYFDSLASIYRDSMRQELAAEGLDIEDCLPREEFEESCVEARHTGLVYAVLNSQIQLISSDSVERNFQGDPRLLEDVLYGDKRRELVSHEYESVPTYKTRMNEIIYEIRDRLPDYPPSL